ncbi:MAG: ribosome small subunit-dependent GTPase A [Chloroflexota bacterium]
MSNHSDDASQESLNNKRYLTHLKKETQRKKLQSAQKVLKRNRQPKPARRKDWLPGQGEDWDDLDYEGSEQIMPAGEGERRRMIARLAFDSKTGQPEPANAPDYVPSGQPGVVIEVSQGLCRVDLGRQTLLCRLRGSLTVMETGFTNVVAVGDEVRVSQDGLEQGVVESVLPRRSLLVRPDVMRPHLRQVIVANADQLLIVASWREPALWPELLDRYLITAERNHLPVKICVNKTDLIEDEAESERLLQPYRALGYRLILTSVPTGGGLAELRGQLQNRTTVLAGLSGVGKSSLLAAVQPGLPLRTAAVNESSGEGRHTTTQATLIRLDDDTAVVDTPGVREFGLSGLARTELARFYPEIAVVARLCRFDDCTHLHEPDCAVKAAVEQGRVSAVRYHNYQQIYVTL